MPGVIKKNIRALLRKKAHSLFTIFFVSYLFILGVSIFIGSISYINYSEIVKEQTGQYNYSMLEQAALVVDGNIDSVQQLMLNVALDPRVQNFLFSKELSNPDVLYNMYKTIESLNGYKNTNIIIEDMYVYFRNIDSVLTNRTRYEAVDFYNSFIGNKAWKYEDWVKVLEGNRYIEFIPVHVDEEVNVKGKNYLNCVTSLPINDRTDPLGAVVMSINTQKLDDVLKKIELLSQGVVYILDSSNNILLQLGEDKYIKTTFEESIVTSKKYFYDKLNKEEIIVSFVPSKINNWKYVSVIPTQRLMEKVNKVRTITLLVIALELIVGLILSYFLAKQNYRPFKILVDDLKRRGNKGDGAIKNEIDFIHEVTLSTVNENDKIKQVMKLQIPIIRNNTLLQLINGNVNSTTGRTELEGLNNLGIAFDSEKFCVMDFHIDDCIDFCKDNSLEQRAMIKFVIVNIIEELANSKHKAYSVDMDWDNVVLLINIPESEFYEIDSVYEIAHHGKDYIEKKFNTIISIGIGTVHSGIKGINESYKESIKALEYKLVRGQGSIIGYKDISVNGRGYVYSLSTESEILSCIKIGDSIRVLNLIEDIFEQNFDNNNISIEEARCLFFDIMSTALKVLNDVDLNYKSIFGEGYEPLQKLINCNTVNDMKDVLKHIYKTICNYICHNKKSHNEELKEKVLQCIENNCNDINFNQSAAADILKMNSSYLSFFFKEQFGENFVDYVNKLRLEKSKLLLKNTDASIDEIACKVGYSNGGYFIRTFKKFENMTPGQYRKSF